jgi:transposase
MKGASRTAIRSRSIFHDEGRPQVMMAGIDIHKRVLQSAVLDPASGEFVEERFSGREGLADWAMRWRGRVATVAIEATTGWRWVARELQAAGFEVRLVDPGQAKALRGK